MAAVADAKFNNTCGYAGDTYAYAYARATLNGTTTTVTQTDPKTGTSVTSHAEASVNGGSISGTPCYSTANAYAQSTALGVSYSTSDTNDGVCPAPAFTATITGPSYVYFSSTGCVTKTWSVSLSGGVSPFTYQWYYNNTAVGTGSTYSRSVCASHASFQLKVVVTGSNGQTAADTHDVVVEYDSCGIDCNCGGPGQPICP